MATRTPKAATRKKADPAKGKAEGRGGAKAKPTKADQERAAAKAKHAAALEARLHEGDAPAKAPRRVKAARKPKVEAAAGPAIDLSAEAAPPAGSSPDEPASGTEAAGHLVTMTEAKGAHNGHTGHAAHDEAAVQADNVAAELMRRRSKPITLDAEDHPVPTLPVGRAARDAEDGAQGKEVLELDPAPPARMQESAPRGLSIPEHYLLLTIEDGWDERREKVRPGGLGGGLVGALLLELVLQGKLRVQRDRFQVTDVPVDDDAHAVAERMKEWQGQPSLVAMGNLAKQLRHVLPAYKERMARRGLIEHREWKHLGLFPRAQVALVDADAQDHLRNKLARAIAGGGRPDAPTILSLGLLEASGLFGLVVPEGAQAYNRKRLNGLLAGKDVMGYKVDDELKGIQEVAVRTILDNVRTMTVRG